MKTAIVISYQCISSPLNKNGYGGSLYSMIKAQNDYIIDFLYFGKKDDEAEREMRSYYRRIIHVDLRTKVNKLGKIIDLLVGRPKLATGYAYKLVNEINEHYDVAVYDTITSIGMRDFIEADKHIAFMIDSTPLYYARRAESEIGIAHYYSKIQSKLLLKYERTFMDCIDKFVYVSKVDAEYEKRLNCGINKFTFVNNGVFINDIDSSEVVTLHNPCIMFSGIMNYAPNKDAVEYLCQIIFPELKKHYPELKLYFVGKNSEAIKHYESESIIVTGRVSNIYSYIKSATVYVSPLRFGTGMKNKILEAMACKKPIVASPVSIEGIDELKNQDNILVATNTQEWISSISYFIENYNARIKFAESCYEIVRNKYSWENAFCELVEGEV